MIPAAPTTPIAPARHTKRCIEAESAVRTARTWRQPARRTAATASSDSTSPGSETDTTAAPRPRQPATERRRASAARNCARLTRERHWLRARQRRKHAASERLVLRSAVPRCAAVASIVVVVHAWLLRSSLQPVAQARLAARDVRFQCAQRDNPARPRPLRASARARNTTPAPRAAPRAERSAPRPGRASSRIGASSGESSPRSSSRNSARRLRRRHSARSSFAAIAHKPRWKTSRRREIRAGRGAP